MNDMIKEIVILDKITYKMLSLEEITHIQT